MYLAMVLGLMLVLPVASMAIEYVAGGGGDLFWLLGKWFVFWAAGVRLLLAGIRQMVQPGFTAKLIFGSDDKGARTIVQELGFANTATGLLGVLSLMRPGFVLPAAIVSAVFFGLAGAKHVANPGKTRLELIATTSDLWVFAALAVFIVQRIMAGAA